MRSGKYLPIGRIRQFKNFFQKGVDKTNGLCYNGRVVKIRPIGQAVKTLASHAGNSGSIPGWVTKKRRKHIVLPSFFADSPPNLNPATAPPCGGKVCAGSQRKQIYTGAYRGSDSRMSFHLPNTSVLSRHRTPCGGKVCAGSQRKQIYTGAHGGSDSWMSFHLPNTSVLSRHRTPVRWQRVGMRTVDKPSKLCYNNTVKKITVRKGERIWIPDSILMNGQRKPD